MSALGSGLMPAKLPRPPYDVELESLLGSIPLPPVVNQEFLTFIRAHPELVPATDIPALIGDRPIAHHEIQVPGYSPEDPEITLSILANTKGSGPKPCFYFVHGGGMILGNRFTGIDLPLAVVEQNEAVAISVEYRLAPENPSPAPVHDCYAGLLWVASHSEQLNIDLKRLFIGGQSAGGGLCAGIALMARDLDGPKLCGQLLCYPMIDDKNETLSSKQYPEDGVWSRKSNDFAWRCLLGEKAGKGGVHVYSAPARATDLSSLPTTFIGTGAAEVFRDENVAFASRLWEAGVQAELHVHAGAYHAPDSLAPTSAVGQEMRKTQLAWVEKLLATDHQVLKTLNVEPSRL